MRHLRPWLSLRPSPCSPTARSGASSRRAGSRSTRGIPTLVQPASVDLRLGDSFRVFHNHRTTAIDLREPPSNLTEEVVVEDGEPFVIHPGEFCLGRTLEWVELPDDIVARIEGKSSIGRLGLIVHATAGFCDPGLEGHADARAQQPHARADQALRRAADRAAVVHDARRPGRAALRLRGLGSHYQGQVAATESRYEAPAHRPVAFRPPMLTALITFAAEEGAEPSKTLFYICGGALVLWALGVSAVGIRSHESCPPTQSAARGVMTVSVVLVLLAMASAVITS